MRHPRLGLLFKQVTRVDASGQYLVHGLHLRGVDSRSLGTVPRSSIVGKVLASFHAKQG